MIKMNTYLVKLLTFRVISDSCRNKFLHFVVRFNNFILFEVLFPLFKVPLHHEVVSVKSCQRKNTLISHLSLYKNLSHHFRILFSL